MNSGEINTQDEQLDSVTARKVRHTISTALSFLRTSGDNLFGPRPDKVQARRLYEVGTTKIENLIDELDAAKRQLADPISGTYASTVEHVYTGSHPEVVNWTRYFEDRTRELQIFEAFEKTTPQSRVRAEVVGPLWYEFSSFMPWFLCQAAAKVSTNIKRHYVIQTAFEELGMRDVREIHPEMFWSAAQFAGCTDRLRQELLVDPDPRQVLWDLKSALLSYETDEEVLGILLGLEIPARENIETVFRSLAYREELATRLDGHKFFQLHRQIEIEHVRLTISNFLRFCDTEEKKARFVRGFMDGIRFWKAFWETASTLIAERARAGRKNAG